MNTVELHAARPNFRFGWLYSQNVDFCMFVLPFFATIAIVLATDNHLLPWLVPAFILSFIEPIIGPFHGGATWFHYFDRRNLNWYCGSKKRLLTFLVAPIVILGVTIWGDMVDQMSTFFVYLVWTIQHLTQQNVGILLLYRREGDAQVPRMLEARLLQIAAIAFGTAYLYRLAFAPSGQRLQMLIAAVVAVNCIVTAVYLKSLLDQVKAGKPINMSALMFWFIALFMWMPLLVGPINFYLAMFLPLMVHWFQYIGLNWQLVKTKYAVTDNRSFLFKGKISPLGAFFVFSSLYVLLAWGCTHSGQMPLDPTLVKALQSVVMGLGLTHYFQDAFIWRFREPYLRETLLPYVRGTV